VKGKLFAGLDDAALREIYKAAQVRSFAAQEVITVKGDRPDHLLLLLSGRAQAYTLTEAGSEILLSWIVPGDIIGLVSLLVKPPAYMASTTTVTDCEFLVWNHSTIRRLAKAYPQLSENGFRLALYYVGVYMKRHSSILTKTAESRLAEALLHLATEAGEVQPTGVAIDITNEQLSSLSDMSHFTASRLLSKWERDGKLSKRRGRVTLLAPESFIAA